MTTLQKILNRITHSGTSLSAGLGLGILALTLAPKSMASESPATGNEACQEGTCHHFDCVLDPSSDTFNDLIKKSLESTHFTDPILEKNGTRILGELKVLVDGGTTESNGHTCSLANNTARYRRYPCAISPDDQSASLYYSKEDNTPKTYITIETDSKGVIICVYDEIGTTLNSLYPELVGHPGPTPFPLPLDLTIGMPKTSFTLEPDGTVTVHVVSLQENIKTLLSQTETVQESLTGLTEELKANLENLTSQVGELGTSIAGDTGVKTALENLQNDVTAIKDTGLPDISKLIGTPTKDLATDLGQVQKDVTAIQADVSEIKTATQTTLSDLIKNASSTLETNLKEALDQSQESQTTTLTEKLFGKDENDQDSVTAQIKKAIKDDGDASRNELAEVSTDLTNKLFGKSVEDKSSVTAQLKQAIVDDGDTTRSKLSDASMDLMTAVEKVTTDLNTSLTTSQNKIISDISEEVKNVSRASDETKKVADNRLIATLQNGFILQTNKLNKNLATKIETTQQAIRGDLQSCLGLGLDTNGKPIGGSFIERQEQTIHTILNQTLRGPEIYESLDTITQILQQHGLLPVQYLGSMEYMLYGHSRLSKTVATSSSIYAMASQFYALTDNVTLRDFQETLTGIAENLIKIASFVETADILTVNTLLPHLIKLFGNKFPIFDTAQLNISRYCSGAHFTSEDYGLYGWVQDVYAELLRLNQAQADLDAALKILYPDDNYSITTPNLLASSEAACNCPVECECKTVISTTTQRCPKCASEAAERLRREFLETSITTRNNIKALLAGLGEGKPVIPTEQFTGLQAYPDILRDYVDIIDQIQANAYSKHLEQKIDSLTEAFKNYQITVDAKISGMYDLLNHIATHFGLCARVACMHHHERPSCPNDPNIDIDNEELWGNGL